MLTATFRNANYKVQLAVFSDEPVRFSVSALRRDEHKFLPFSAGDQVYYGESFRDAWATVERYIPGSQIPDKFKEFLK